MAKQESQKIVVGDDPLRASGLPIVFEIGNRYELGLDLPQNRHGQSVRVWARSLSGMQKEAIAVSVRSGKAWRLASDEGPYLNGNDAAPCPLSFLTTGMVASYLTEILALAGKRAIRVDEITLVQDNYYTMEGSALRGTMVGGALPVDLDVQIDTDADDTALMRLLTDAVQASPLNGLMREVRTSLFTLSLNSHEIAVGRVAACPARAEPDPGDRFALVRPGTADYADLIRRQRAIETQHGVDGGAGSSLEASQSRTLHLRGTCRLLPDGRREITQELFSPLGSTFRFLCDETPEFGGLGRAPDAATYIAAGIAFCFMTQFGRYASIVRKRLHNYRVIQDAHFSIGGASGDTEKAGFADPIETHVFLDTDEGEEFAKTALDMAEQTCFLHAFCRTELETRIKVTRQ